MWTSPRRLFSALTDATVGTAIVMVQVMLAERIRLREIDDVNGRVGRRRTGLDGMWFGSR